MYMMCIGDWCRLDYVISLVGFQKVRLICTYTYYASVANFLMKYSQRVVEVNSGRNRSRDQLNEGLWLFHCFSLVSLYYHCHHTS